MSDSPSIKRTVYIICVLSFNFITSVLSQCSGSLTLTATDDFTTITSPGYTSGSYANDLSCSWIIDSGSATDTIALYITHHAFTSPDKIDVYNGFSTSNTSLASLTGTATNKNYQTTGQYALIVLTTDSSGQAQGFTAKFLRAADLSGTGCTAEQTIYATTTPQYLTSPSFPNSYASNSNCRWVITATGGSVEFDVILSDIESSPNCGFDYLKIYDSSYLCEHTLTVDACAQNYLTTFNYKSNGTSILVKFNSDASLGYTGFKLKYTSVVETTTATSVSSAGAESAGFGLGIGVGFAGGFISALMTVGLILIIKSRVQASQLGSPRVRNVLPLQTPTSMNGHLPNGDITSNRKSSNSSSSGKSFRTSRTSSTRQNSPVYTDSNNAIFNIKNDHNHKRNGVLPTRISLPN